jgi:hypothetical protein
MTPGTPVTEAADPAQAYINFGGSATQMERHLIILGIVLYLPSLPYLSSRRTARELKNGLQISARHTPAMA